MVLAKTGMFSDEETYKQFPANFSSLRYRQQIKGKKPAPQWYDLYQISQATNQNPYEAVSELIHNYQATFLNPAVPPEFNDPNDPVTQTMYSPYTPGGTNYESYQSFHLGSPSIKTEPESPSIATEVGTPSSSSSLRSALSHLSFFRRPQLTAHQELQLPINSPLKIDDFRFRSDEEI